MDEATRAYFTYHLVRPIDKFAVTEEDPPEPIQPGEVSLAIQLEHHGIPLWPGGYMDQPFHTMELLTVCGNVRQEVERTRDLMLQLDSKT